MARGGHSEGMTAWSSDAELVAAARAGDARAFGALVARHQQAACAVACAASGDPASAEDLAQEAFVVAWRRLGALSEPDRFGPWLCGIVRNVARAARRHQRRHAPAATAAPERLGQIPAEAPTPLEEAAAREALGRAWAALGRLPRRHRESLVLYCRLGESHAQVAAALGVSEEAVRQRLSRARRQLRDGVEAIERELARGRVRRALAPAVIALIWARHAASARAATATTTATATATATGGVGAGASSWLAAGAPSIASVAAGAAAGVMAAIALVMTGPGGAAHGAADTEAAMASRSAAAKASSAEAPGAGSEAAHADTPDAVTREALAIPGEPVIEHARRSDAHRGARRDEAAASITAAPIIHGPAVVTPLAAPRRRGGAPQVAMPREAPRPLLRPAIRFADLDLMP